MQNVNLEQEVIDLSKKKWQWMSECNMETMDALFHEKSVFVHMGGSWGKEREMEIIRSGGIHYKKADIHEVSVNVIGTTAILLNRISHQSIHGDRSVCAARGQLQIGVALVHQIAYPGAKLVNKKTEGENDANCKIKQWR